MLSFLLTNTMTTFLANPQDDALSALIAMLDVNSPFFPGSNEMRELLGGPARAYIELGVLPLLDSLRCESTTSVKHAPMGQVVSLEFPSQLRAA
ncbi:MAG: hypothetical protein ACYCZ6_18200 [Polaromonas sp.]